MMQHKDMTGVAIGTGRRCADDEERRIRLERIDSAARFCRDDSPWFALRCWTGRETAVDKALGDLGIVSLVPMRKGPDHRRRGRIIEGKMMPVIHGYVLVQVAPEPVYLDAMKAVDHVIDVLGGAERPKRLSASEVNHFKAMADKGAYDWERPSGLVVKAGERVRTVDGPFAGFLATVVTPNGRGRGDVVISVDIFGRQTPVTVPLAILEKL